MSRGGKAKVLVVDDEPDLLDVSKDFLEMYGRFEVDTSKSAVEALSVKDIDRYDVIVSDYQMPEMDGIEFLKHLRARGINVPFILFTGKGREEVAINALNAGADFYLKKGTDVKAQYTELSNFIDHALARHSAYASIEYNLKRFRMLVESTSEIIEVVDCDRRIRYVNPAVELYFGLKPEDVLGIDVLSALPKHEQDRLEDLANSLIEGKTEKAKELILVRHVNGSYHLLDVTIARFADGPLGPELIVNAKEVPIEPAYRELDLII